MAPSGYQFHLLDLPGFGQTQLPPQPWGVADYVRFVLAYLDSCGLDQVAILGHSFGGRISLVLAADYPARVSKMVLADSAGLRTPPSLKFLLRHAVARTFRNTLDVLGLKSLRLRLQESYNRRYASSDYLTAGALRDTFLRVIDEDLASFAARIQAPTVLIWGDQDLDTPLWQGRKLEQLIPDAGLIVFQGAGHFAYQERLEDYVRIVDNFLSKGS
jgi:pimeloyl-ACP methyl ester carboxylesterase